MTQVEMQYLQMQALNSVLGSALGEFDKYTQEHSKSVSALSVMIANFLHPNWKLHVLEELAAGGALHDIGKLTVPRQILNGSSSELSGEEWHNIYDHPVRGVRIVEQTGLFIPNIVRDCILYHHERWDGRKDCERPGYPFGLKGEAIPECARIVAVADTWSAITTARTYQAALPPVKAMERLRTLAGGRLDPNLVKIFETFVYINLAA